MSLGTRLSLATAVALAAAIAFASAATYIVVRDELRGEIDASLRDRALVFAQAPARTPRTREHLPRQIPSPRLGAAGGYFQFVKANGTTTRPPGERDRVPVESRDRLVAAGRAKAFFSDRVVSRTHVRVYTARLSAGVAVQVARPLTEVDRALARTKLFLFLTSLAGIALAAALGRGVAQATLAPVRRLTRAAERIAATRDLRSRADSTRSGELGRLAGAFNSMLDALASSLTAQRQLVADASHELRTPLTSARTNLEVLQLDHDMPVDERRRILADAVGELTELTHLIEDLVELARSEQQPPALEPVYLDVIAQEVLGGAARRAPQIRFTSKLEPTVVLGAREALARAIGNLLDNAVKWSSPGGAVDVAVAHGRVSVRDHGPGIDPADLPHVFDRFYRAASARTRPGSGLGLAIVRQVAEAHGGTADARNAPGGGSLFRIELPMRPLAEPEEGLEPSAACLQDRCSTS